MDDLTKIASDIYLLLLERSLQRNDVSDEDAVKYAEQSFRLADGFIEAAGKRNTIV